MIFSFVLIWLYDQSSGALNSWADTRGNQYCGREKSGNSGGDMVLDVCIGHFEIPFC